MPRYSRGTRVQVYFGETDQIGHTPRYQAILEYLRKEGAAGATVVRGLGGFGANSKIHTAAILRLSLDLPVVLTWIDAPGRVQRLLPGLIELAGSGVVTVTDVEIAAYGGRRLEQLRFDLQVRDAMTTPVVSISERASVREVVEALVGRSFRALPVVDAAGRIVGVVSGGDLVQRGRLQARIELLNAMSPPDRETIVARLSRDVPVGEIMSREPATVRATDTVASATHLMAERQLKRIPVIDAEHKLVGIVSRADILRAVAETFPKDVDEAGEHPGAVTVGELMRVDVPKVNADADLATLLDVVISTRLNRAVVVDHDNRVLGVVNDADIMRSVDPSAAGGVLGALMRTAGRPLGGQLRARDLLSRPPVSVRSDATIAEAAVLMTETPRKILCITDADGRLLGIVDRADLLLAAGEALRDLAPSAGNDDDE